MNIRRRTATDSPIQTSEKEQEDAPRHLAHHNPRGDELPKCVTSVDELLTALFTEAKVDGLFTDFPDLIR